MEHLVPICYLEGYLLYHNVRTSELKVIDSEVSTVFEDDIFEYKQSTFMKLALAMNIQYILFKELEILP